MSYVQRLSILFIVFLIALPLSAQQRDLTDADRAAIRTVIERQLEALRQDDAVGAFALASPEIQAKFETPERFMTMVQTWYQPVYRPRQVVFRDLNPLAGQPTQAVLLVGPDGVPVMALYPMQQQPDGVWKIAGCYLVPFKMRSCNGRKQSAISAVRTRFLLQASDRAASDLPGKGTSGLRMASPRLLTSTSIRPNSRRQDGIYGALHLIGLGHIDQQQHHTAACIFGNLCCSILDVPGRQRIEHDICPCCCQHLRNPFANPAPSPCDKHNFPCNVISAGNILPPPSL